MGWEVFPLAIRRIVNGNHAILRSHARPVQKINDAIITLLDDMAETMYENKGVGLAAPQIGIAKRLIVVDPGEDRLIKLINPRCLEWEGETADVEGCLSIPGIYGEVPRASRVLVEALDTRGKQLRLEAEGARAAGKAPRFVVRREYRRYYLISVLFGARKQLFITFGPWMAPPG